MLFPFGTEIHLENERVKLEPLSLDHLPFLSPIAIQNPKLLQYSPSKFGTVSYLKDFIESHIELRIKHQRYPFAIFCKTLNKYAGSTSYLNISNANQRLEIGSTWIGKDFQRTGLNRNMKFLLMRYAFETLECKRLEFKTDARNLQSQKAIQAIGGIYEGTLRSHTVMSDGFRRDTVYYSVLPSEWPNIKQSVFKSIL